jgi:hypothetical protein
VHLRVSLLAAAVVAAGCGSSTRPPLGMRVPATYEAACTDGGGGLCSGRVSGPVPGALRRTPRFPGLAAGGKCPGSTGHPVVTPFTGRIIALGFGPVEMRVDNAGDLLRGVADLGRTDEPGWLALKTHFFARPSYRGPFVVRVRRIDGPGVVELGGSPTNAPLVVPPGPTANTVAGWREVPVFTWMKVPGCYAWSIDGLGFHETVVLRARLARRM